MQTSKRPEIVGSVKRTAAIGMRKLDIFTCPGVKFRKLDGKLEKVRKIQYCTSTEISGIC